MAGGAVMAMPTYACAAASFQAVFFLQAPIHRAAAKAKPLRVADVSVRIGPACAESGELRRHRGLISVQPRRQRQGPPRAPEIGRADQRPSSQQHRGSSRGPIRHIARPRMLMQNLRRDGVNPAIVFR